MRYGLSIPNKSIPTNRPIAPYPPPSLTDRGGHRAVAEQGGAHRAHLPGVTDADPEPALPPAGSGRAGARARHRGGPGVREHLPVPAVPGAAQGGGGAPRRPDQGGRGEGAAGVPGGLRPGRLGGPALPPRRQRRALPRAARPASGPCGGGRGRGGGGGGGGGGACCPRSCSSTGGGRRGAAGAGGGARGLLEAEEAAEAGAGGRLLHRPDAGLPVPEERHGPPHPQEHQGQSAGVVYCVVCDTIWWVR
jgi:translation initiation factor IF-2